MRNDEEEEVDPGFSLTLGGPLYQFYLRTRLVEHPHRLVKRRMILFLLLSWLPLLVLSFAGGRALAGVEVPFLVDIGTNVRFLIALPLLLFAEIYVHQRLARAVRQFALRQLVVGEDLRKFDAAVNSLLRWRNSAIVEFLILAACFTIGHWLWLQRIPPDLTSWFVDPPGRTLTTAGWWFAYVSLPLFRFLLLRWLYRLVLWHLFLWRVSRLSLRLNVLHPDRSGGVAFVGGSALAFGPLLLAFSTLMAGQLATRILFQGAKLTDFKFEILGFVVVLLLFVVVSQAFFIGPLGRARRVGLNQYSVQGSRYVDAFRRKWLEDPETTEDFLGSPDIQSLADLAAGYDVAFGMRPFPMHRKDAIQLILTMLLPLLPLVLTMISLKDLLNRVVSVLL